jgi:LmbE family N-acetylglucosaminyl deacetylase
MRSRYDTIYLSPHLDDVVLSCGGQIYKKIQAGEQVLIVTIMAGDPPVSPLSNFARGLHDRWQLGAQTVASRREEDIAALTYLGADYLHWPVPDCIYRADPASGEALYASEEALFGNVNANEADLLNSLGQLLETLPPHWRLLAPLTVGNHVDHQLTRQAAELWLRPKKPIYYEDYPYARQENAVVIATTPQVLWRPEIIPLADDALQAKIDATLYYKSQIGTFFADFEELSSQMNSYCFRIGGERIWHERIE